MNSIMERWVQTCRHELLDRTLIWNQRHLLHALREFEHLQDGLRGEVPGSRILNPGLSAQPSSEPSGHLWMHWAIR